jgi:prepilin-type N-terminal cleavage/methylation domain-containing protein
MARHSRFTRAGFTLIELLIVIVVIGVLVAIVVPKYANTKTKGYVAAMITDLKNLSTAEEAFYADSNYYYSGTLPSTVLRVGSSLNVTLTLQNVSSSGWAATATHPSTTRTCALYFGTGGPLPPATQEGVVMCDP